MKKEEQNPLRRFELSAEELEDVSGGKLEDLIPSEANLANIIGILSAIVNQPTGTLTLEQAQAEAVSRYLFVIKMWYPDATQEDVEQFVADHYNEVVNK